MDTSTWYDSGSINSTSSVINDEITNSESLEHNNVDEEVDGETVIMINTNDTTIKTIQEDDMVNTKDNHPSTSFNNMYATWLHANDACILAYCTAIQ
jgi:hypothetical protein